MAGQLPWLQPTRTRVAAWLTARRQGRASAPSQLCASQGSGSEGVSVEEQGMRKAGVGQGNLVSLHQTSARPGKQAKVNPWEA